MSGNTHIHVAKAPWTQVSKRIAQANKVLATEFSQVLKNSTVYSARYSYGDLIASDGQFAPPCSNGACKCSLCEELRSKTGYASIPLGLVVDKSAEVHLLSRAAAGSPYNRLITSPLRMLHAGDLFGVFETVEYLKEKLRTTVDQPWCISSGARSIYVMAHLDNEKTFYTPLLSIAEKQAKRLIRIWDHFTEEDAVLIKQIALLADIKYVTEVVLFPLEAVQKLWNNVATRALMLDVHETQARHLLTHAIEDAHIHVKGSHTNDPYYRMRTIQHIMRIARGDVPGMVPVTSEKSQCGPFIEVQRWLMQQEWYHKKSAVIFPAILQPSHLKDSGASCYYSLGWPSLLVRPPLTEKRLRSGKTEAIRVRDDITDHTTNDMFLDANMLKAVHLSIGESLPVEEFIPADILKDIDSITVVNAYRRISTFFSAALKVVRR